MRSYGGLGYLFAMSRENGGIQMRKSLRLIVHLLRYCITLPWYLLERCYARRIRNVTLRTDPVFVIGHYRSGTSFMQRLLSCDEQFSYITNMEVLFPYLPRRLYNFMKWCNNAIASIFHITYYHLNDVRLYMDDPMEGELVLAYHLNKVTPYWSYVFPNSTTNISLNQTFLDDSEQRSQWTEEYLWLLKRTVLTRGDKRMMLKSPTNTGRIAMLLSLFPNARFIYLRRDPYSVFNSMIRMLQNTHTYYSLQVADIKPAEVIRNYCALIDRYEQEKHLIDAQNVIEVDYEELVAETEMTIRNIYAHLDLESPDTDWGQFANFIEANTSYKRSEYPKPILDKESFYEELEKCQHALAETKQHEKQAIKVESTSVHMEME